MVECRRGVKGQTVPPHYGGVPRDRRVCRRGRAGSLGLGRGSAAHLRLVFGRRGRQRRSALLSGPEARRP
eukprot:COSAG01_NODE_41731_length_447_cov_210.034483_1_plen_69_part_01